MEIVICPQRQQILEASGHLLVLGGPGSGKTTIALKKALRLIDEGLDAGQAILFLSFSRAAVARIAEASKTAIEKSKRHQLSIQTFHSFCWELLSSHGYLIGSPRSRLELLMPHDEKSLSGGLKPPAKGMQASPEWLNWVAERQRLFNTEGKITFDLFAPKAAQLLSTCPLVLELVASRYPVIIVDEAQDTGHDAWRCIELLAACTQVICLGDLEQQIFDHLDGVGPERITDIQNALKPLRVDLGSVNNRSPGTEIATFANDILGNVVRGAPYTGVTRHMYDPQADLGKRLRIVLGQIKRSVRKQTGSWPESVAILATTGAGVAKISAALNNPIKPVRHKVLFDEASVLLSARLAAFLLEPKQEQNLSLDMAKCLEFLAAMRRVDGSKAAYTEAAKYMGWGLSLAAGKSVKTQLCCSLETLIQGARELSLTGAPGADWILIKRLLRASDQPNIRRIAENLDFLIAFNRGKRIAANLATMWMVEGAYVRAREALDAALVEDQLLAGIDDLKGIHVMTIHKSKGKQFDAVIILREGRRIGPRSQDWQSSLVWRDDVPPYMRSRKILRVGITRAKNRVILLEPVYPRCPILTPHKL